MRRHLAVLQPASRSALIAAWRIEQNSECSYSSLGYATLDEFDCARRGRNRTRRGLSESSNMARIEILTSRAVPEKGPGVRWSILSLTA